MEKLIVKDYELTVKLPSFINIIGLPNSGKTYLLRMLINQIPNQNLFLDEQNINDLDINFKKRNIACALNLKFNTPYVKEELLYCLDKCDFNIGESFDLLDEFADYFDLEAIINEKLAEITITQRALVKILSLLILKPKILGIDNLLSYLSEDIKLKIIKYAKKEKITILNITSNSEELLLGNDIVVLETGKVKVHQKTKKLLENEKLLASIGFELPFIVNLSNGLRLYEVMDKLYFNHKSLVGDLWQ